MVRKLRESMRAIGAWNTLLLALARALRWVFGGRVRIVKYHLTAQPIVSREPARPSGFMLAWADLRSPLLSQVERPRAVIEARFAQRARCLVATTAAGRETRIAGFFWYVAGPYDEDEVRVRFCPLPERTAVWDFDVVVMPAHRMSRLFGYLWSSAEAELASQGFTSSMSRISVFNPDSLAAHRRLGAKIVGQATFLCAGRVQLMTTTLAPKWHLSWRDDQRPVVRVGA